MTDARCDIVRHSLLPLTQDVILRDLSPADWLHCASFLTGLLERAPLSTGANDATGWNAERWILGVLASELRLLAHEAGENAEVEPRTFGQDPVGAAREYVAEVTEARRAAEREWQRRLGDGRLREERRIAREEAQFAAADAGVDIPSESLADMPDDEVTRWLS